MTEETNSSEPVALRDKLEELNIAQLKDMLRDSYAHEEVPFAKRPSNPSKADLIAFIITLDSFEKNQKTEVQEISVPSLDEVIKPVPAREYAKLTPTQKKELKEKMVRVKIRKNPLFQSMSTSVGHVEFLPWTDSIGQRRLAKVAFNVPWHVPRQVLMSLAQAKSSEFIQNGNSVIEDRDRESLYDIEILKQLDISQMSSLADVQRSRRK